MTWDRIVHRYPGVFTPRLPLELEPRNIHLPYFFFLYLVFSIITDTAIAFTTLESFMIILCYYTNVAGQLESMHMCQILQCT